MIPVRGRRLASLALLVALVACQPPPSPVPSPTATPEPSPEADAARAAAGKFLVNWRIERYARMVELLSPDDVARVGADEIVAQLEEFAALLRLTSLVAEVGTPLAGSLPPGTRADGTGAVVEGPRPALIVPVRFEVGSELFGALSFRRMLALTRALDGWQVRWDPSLLVPGLVVGGHLELERELGPRGRIVARDGTVFAMTREDGARVYPQETLAGQTVGWVGAVTDLEALDLAPRGYLAGDVIGRAGLEAGAEELLRGQPGYRLVAVAPDGSRLVGLERPMRPGADVQITIRPELQATAEAAIARYTEAATAVVDPNSGDVWALASAPLFNPNAMTLGTRLDGTPLAAPSQAARTNFAVQGAYPAGSSFKPFTLAAALQIGVATPATRMPCQGTWVYDGFTFHNYEDHSLPGLVSLTQAMAFSCNTTYMPLSIMVYNADRAALTDLVAEFGFGRSTGIRHLADAPGKLPDAAYFRVSPRWDGVIRSYGPFDQIQLAIGQGEYLGTALQLAIAYAAFGNGGRLWVPRLVTGASLPDGAPVERNLPREANRISLSAEQLAYVVESLEAVVTLPYGTATYAFAGFGIQVAGKSGTAETGGPAPDAWFPAFAPSVDPSISVATVLVRVPLATGGSDAAPLVRRVMAHHFALL